MTDPGGGGTLTPNGECRYTDSSSDVVVSPAGVIVSRSHDDNLNQFRVAIAFPEQTLSGADIAGTWNMLGANLVSGNSTSTASYGAVAGTITISGTGDVSGEFCQNIAPCSTITDTITASSNPSGGFDVFHVSDSSTSHLYAYRGPLGDVSMVNVDDDGSVVFFTKQRTNTVSAVGAKNDTWGMWMNTNYVSTNTVTVSTFTTTANDATTWTRQSDIDGHFETLSVNAPRDGYTHRPQGTATTTAGANVPVNEFTALGLAGAGVSILWLPSIGTMSAPGALFFAVTRPSQ